MNENESSINEVRYDLSFLKSPKWIIVLIILFVSVIFFNFPLKKKLDNLIYSSLKISSQCHLKMQDYSFNVFPLPHVSIENLTIPGRCLGPKKASINIKEMDTYFRGPSFSPLGLSFKVETIFENIPIEFFIIGSPSTIVLVLKESMIPLGKLKRILPQVKLSGNAKTDLYVELENNKLKALNINLQSNNFSIPAQNIFDFDLMALDINDLHLVASTDEKSKLNISKFVLGSESSPIRSGFTGMINLNTNNMMNSELDLKGEIALSESLTQDFAFSMVKSYLDKFDKEDNFYQIQIKGPLYSPQASSKR